jgi:hypothetical protein
MIPISLTWDTREKLVLIKWNGFFSFGWEKGKPVKTIFKIPIPYRSGAKRDKTTHFPPMRWSDLKGVFSFLREWKLKRAVGTLSFRDPMVNGVLYGWLSALGSKKENRKIDLTIDFLGKNWCSGEATVPPKVAFHYFRRWFPLFLKKGRKLPKGGE